MQINFNNYVVKILIIKSFRILFHYEIKQLKFAFVHLCCCIKQWTWKIKYFGLFYMLTCQGVFRILLCGDIWKVILNNHTIIKIKKNIKPINCPFYS